MATILKGEIEFDGEFIRFAYDENKIPHLTCFDVGKIFSSQSITNGGRQTFVRRLGEKQKKYYPVKDLFNLLKNPRDKKEEKKKFLYWVDEQFNKREEQLHRVFSVGRKTLTIKGNISQPVFFVDGILFDEEKDENEEILDSIKHAMDVMFPEKEPDLAERVVELEKELKQTQKKLKKDEKGCVYVLEDKSSTGMYKVGKTRDLERRMKEYGCGSSKRPIPHHVFECDDDALLEKCMHYAFQNTRQGRTEIFDVPLVALRVVGNVLSMIEKFRILNEETFGENKPVFDEILYVKKCEEIILDNDASKILKELVPKKPYKFDQVANDMVKLGEISEFVLKNGAFPTRRTDPRLSDFVDNFRRRHTKKGGSLDSDVVRKAVLIPGWTWENHETYFDKLVFDVDVWIEKNGHAPTIEENNVLYERLRTWKKAYGKKPNEQEYERLDEVFKKYGLGFVHSVTETAFGEKILELKEYIKTYETPPSCKISGIGTWLSDQRKRYKKTEFNGETWKKEILDSVVPGWYKDQNQLKWEKQMEKQVEYFQLHGHVSPNNKFLSKCRTELKNRKSEKTPALSLEREHELDEKLPGWEKERKGSNYVNWCDVCKQIKLENLRKRSSIKNNS